MRVSETVLLCLQRLNQGYVNQSQRPVSLSGLSGDTQNHCNTLIHSDICCLSLHIVAHPFSFLRIYAYLYLIANPYH